MPERESPPKNASIVPDRRPNSACASFRQSPRTRNTDPLLRRGQYSCEGQPSRQSVRARRGDPSAGTACVCTSSSAFPGSSPAPCTCIDTALPKSEHRRDCADDTGTPQAPASGCAVACRRSVSALPACARSDDCVACETCIAAIRAFHRISPAGSRYTTAHGYISCSRGIPPYFLENSTGDCRYLISCVILFMKVVALPFVRCGVVTLSYPCALDLQPFPLPPGI